MSYLLSANYYFFFDSGKQEGKTFHRRKKVQRSELGVKLNKDEIRKFLYKNFYRYVYQLHYIELKMVGLKLVTYTYYMTVRQTIRMVLRSIIPGPTELLTSNTEAVLITGHL